MVELRPCERRVTGGSEHKKLRPRGYFSAAAFGLLALNLARARPRPTAVPTSLGSCPRSRTAHGPRSSLLLEQPIPVAASTPAAAAAAPVSGSGVATAPPSRPRDQLPSAPVLARLRRRMRRSYRRASVAVVLGHAWCWPQPQVGQLQGHAASGASGASSGSALHTGSPSLESSNSGLQHSPWAGAVAEAEAAYEYMYEDPHIVLARHGTAGAHTHTTRLAILCQVGWASRAG